MKLVLGILILVSAVFLVVAVLMQSGSSKRLSGSIAGAAETFFGKNKGKTIDRLLSRLTNVVAVVFALLVLGSFLITNRTEKTDTTTDDDTSTEETVQETEGVSEETKTTAETEAEVTTEATETEADVTTEATETEAAGAETVADTTAAQ